MNGAAYVEGLLMIITDTIGYAITGITDGQSKMLDK
jgi:hypothetical protein